MVAKRSPLVELALRGFGWLGSLQGFSSGFRVLGL